MQDTTPSAFARLHAAVLALAAALGLDGRTEPEDRSPAATAMRAERRDAALAEYRAAFAAVTGGATR